MIRPFICALQLLTRLPIQSSKLAPQAEDLGQSVLFFPVVGLFIGVLLVGVCLVMSQNTTHSSIVAGILLTIWVVITGGLHLDGLADTADAWIGGHGDRERTLAIMKDPSSGPSGIVAIALVLVNKFAALQTLVATHSMTALILAPVLGRTMIILLLLTTPYARPNGLGSPYANYLPRQNGSLMIALVVAVTGVLLKWHLFPLLMVLSVFFLSFQHWIITQLGGATGDTLGAACELTETAALLALAANLAN